jgi:hypothetical protein
MPYKTITLGLMQERNLPATIPLLDRYSGTLRDSHEAWKALLARRRPGGDPSQLSSEAMELALEELEHQLRTEMPQSDQADGPLNLDDAMSFIRRRTPTA